ncbi:MAG: carboxypeptidase M32, partial [Deltaproteobacteria bacterium]
ALGHGGSRYDALLDSHEPGLTQAKLVPLFARLVPELRRLTQAIGERKGASRRPFVGRRFDLARQWDVSLLLLSAIGFDLGHGRLDRSAHPFSSGIHPTDVRLTNRFREDDPLPGIFGALHEGGHGLYEQGFAPEIHGTPLAEACSFGLHESQSRLWENLVGRSRPFWRHFFPELRHRFPAALADCDAEGFYAAVNEVRPTYIRVEADEVTYNLHIAVRLRLEAALVGGDLAVKDLPAAWSEAMQAQLGLTPPDDAQGVLQDIHWAWGDLGYFPTYTLGNLYAASLLRAAERDLPGLWDGIERGELSPLREWLRRKIHARGHLEEAEPTVRAATGEGLTEEPFVDYLWEKYGELYGVRRETPAA